MASLIESVRKLHGPALVEHDNGYDVDVICPECTRLRTEALERAGADSEDWGYAAELPHVHYPCPTRVVAGTTSDEGKDESARMRLEHLVEQREELEERLERLDAVVGLIRRDLGEDTSEHPGPEQSLVEESSAESNDSSLEVLVDNEPDATGPDTGPSGADDYDF